MKNKRKFITAQIVVLSILSAAFLLQPVIAAEDSGNATRRELAKKVDVLSKEREKLKIQLGVLEERFAKYRQEQETPSMGKRGKEEIVQLRQRVEVLRSENEKLREGLDLARQSDTAKKLMEARQSIKNFEERIYRMRREIARQREELDKYAVLSKKLLARNAQLSKARSEMEGGESADTELAGLRQQNTALKERVQSLESKIADLQRSGRGQSEREGGKTGSVAGTDPQVARATKLYEQGMNSEASAIFKDVLERDPDNLRAGLGLAYCKYSKNLYRDALDMALAMEKLHPDNAQVYRLKGLAAWRCGELGRASGAFRQALEIVPDSPLIHNYLGVVCYAQGDYETARREFKHAVELDDGLVEAHYNLAVLLSSPEKSDFVQARKHYEKAIELGRKRDEELEDKLYR